MKHIVAINVVILSEDKHIQVNLCNRKLTVEPTIASEVHGAILYDIEGLSLKEVIEDVANSVTFSSSELTMHFKGCISGDAKAIGETEEHYQGSILFHDLLVITINVVGV